LRARYEALRAASRDELVADSPFNKRPDFELPRYFTTKRIEVSDLNASRAPAGEQPTQAQVAAIIDGLNDEGYWPTPLRAVANPYIGDGSAEPAEGDFGQTRVGDASDTSPYISDKPVEGISISSFIDAMSMLIRALDTSDEPVVWRLDNLETIGGHAVTITGAPRIIDTPGGKALEFDGIDDGIFFDVHPLQGATEFTVEVVFNPYQDGAAEQRFFHMQEDASDARVMFETRLVEGERWFLDTFIKSGEQRVTLFAENHAHEIGPWRHAAIVVDGATMRHYVDGQLELSAPLLYSPQGSGRTSLGVRINKVHWFKGAIRTARFTPRVLVPDEFLTAAG
jgi:hypothetical protein